ncbi:hypothetical protein IQ273_31595 [Nodosilinea sp. LEGE 07298]|uniref:hypothetical protein n=1 Tax=Nodosilinea sp. LEGE 07298 TaxID=2777970 RepID=UPI00188268A6|nr:hypothetical protein [Nodosilinea sp. LEGE 07298]MBE9113917.1 hypothetical protein [Nodosilinea sp. LEGE 07298]
MVYPNDAYRRQQLETAYEKSPAQSFSTQFLAFLQQIGAALVNEFTRDRTAPRISKYYDVEGKVLWHVYDPNSRQRFTTPSELEVQEWLECRHLE